MSEEIIPKQKNLKWLKITGIVLVTIIIFTGVGFGAYYLITGTNNLSPAPDFTVEIIGGGNFTLSDFQGKVVLIDFMSVTCVPCQELMPEIKDIFEEFNDSLIVISIDVDLSDTTTQLLNFKKDFNASWSFAFDSDDLQNKYTVVQIPKTVIIDKEGYITYSEIGLSAGGDLKEKVQETIEGTANRISAGYGFSLATAFVAGVLSFFSPCAFPLLPGYMAFNLDLLIKDESKEMELQKEKGEEELSNKKRIRRRVWKSFLWGSSAALGIALFYMIIGLIAAFVGEAVGQWVEYITPVIGGLLIILGIISLTPVSFDMSFIINKIDRFSENRRKKKAQREESDEELESSNKNKKRNLRNEAPQMFQLFLYGITYALASIGCNLPILLGLTLSAIEAGRFDKAIIIFVIYSLAMALLMVIITTLVGFSKDILINKLRASTKFVKIFSGVLLILAGGFLIGYFLWNFFDK